MLYPQMKAANPTRLFLSAHALMLAWPDKVRKQLSCRIRKRQFSVPLFAHDEIWAPLKSPYTPSETETTATLNGHCSATISELFRNSGRFVVV